MTLRCKGEPAITDHSLLGCPKLSSRKQVMSLLMARLHIGLCTVGLQCRHLQDERIVLNCTSNNEPSELHFHPCCSSPTVVHSLGLQGGLVPRTPPTPAAVNAISVGAKVPYIKPHDICTITSTLAPGLLKPCLNYS